MLKPALLYKEEIQREISSYAYNEDMFLYTGSLGFYTPNFENNDDGSLYQYAIVNGESDRIFYISCRLEHFLCQ